MIGPRRHQILSAATVAGAGNSGNLTNLTQDANAVLTVVLSAGGVGTNIVVNVYAVDDLGHQYLLGTLTATAGALQQRGAYSNVIEPQLYFSWTVSGGNATSVDLNAYMTSPDN